MTLAKMLAMPLLSTIEETNPHPDGNGTYISHINRVPGGWLINGQFVPEPEQDLIIEVRDNGEVPRHNTEEMIEMSAAAWKKGSATMNASPLSFKVWAKKYFLDHFQQAIEI